MSSTGLNSIILVLIFSVVVATMAEGLQLLMPSVQPKKNDTILCYEFPLNGSLYITGFKPQVMKLTHHIRLSGCPEPSGFGKPWECPRRVKASSGDFDVGPVCKVLGNVLFAGGPDAPEIKLPDGVGIKVGGDTGINSLVLEVHYLNIDHSKDSSGIVLATAAKPTPKTAGILLVGSAGEIPAHSAAYWEGACEYDQPLTLHPFAFRVHTHYRGKVVSGYRVRDGQWTEIGRESPDRTQVFYPTKGPEVTVKTGDILAVRCTMVNNEDRIIKYGENWNDGHEMCTFYMMYYVAGDRLPKKTFCYTPGAPSWKWSNVAELHAENVPKSASVIPGTNVILQESTSEERTPSSVDKNTKHQSDLTEFTSEFRKFN